MRDHELELIAALVEGRLDDESKARALVASSSELSEEYEAQKLAYEALTGAGTVALSDAERSDLRRDVWSALRTPQPSAAANPWYLHWAPSAAGLLLVVGLVAVINQGNPFGGADRLAADEATATSTTAAAAEAAEDRGGGDEGIAPAPLSEGSDTDALTEDEIAFYAGQAERLREGELPDTQASSPETLSSSALETCLVDAGLVGFTVVASRTASTAEETGGSVDPPRGVTSFIAAIPEDTDISTAPIAFVDPDACELIHVDD
jgi:hypothetical protein